MSSAPPITSLSLSNLVFTQVVLLGYLSHDIRQNMLELKGNTKEELADIFLDIILHVQVNILCNRYPVPVRKSNL